MFTTNIEFVRHCCDCDPMGCGPGVPMGQCRTCAALEDNYLEELEHDLDQTWAGLSLKEKRRLIELLFE